MKDYLVCIDSDGCAIDSMDIKHKCCFGPGIVEIWNLEPWKEEILDRWNEINLYSMTRGINRFLGLEMMLSEIDAAYRKIDGIERYSQWCRETDTFSNDALEAKMKEDRHPIFEQAFQWSLYVNRKNDTIADEIHPFEGVREALDEICKFADIAIVSSANPKAVQEEWTRFGFLAKVDYVMTQDAGTKAACIGLMLERGYQKERIVMVGDAPGDERAARDNGVRYFPILAGHECDSWIQLRQEMLPRLMEDLFDDEYQEYLLKKFFENLE